MELHATGTPSDLAGSCIATALDWTGHRQLGHARSIEATAHCRQPLLRRPEHFLEYNYNINSINDASHKYQKKKKKLGPKI